MWRVSRRMELVYTKLRPAAPFLIGAEINAEMERQTRKDTTTDGPRPLGQRRAYAADTVGHTP